ncbi:class I SAM-dependent methyltransferase [Neolewinella sp.]|uniref:class I SAM-dependent methyltransferase n=1 Tax=Neolewinella sp. TaxID=2993543 RepID=UPI003B52E550
MGLKAWVRRQLSYYRSGRQLRRGSHALQTTEASHRERAKPGSRAEIINLLLGTFDRPATYLEIGVRRPEDNFTRIEAAIKYGVDPGVEYLPNPVDFPLTSDAFFTALRAGKLLSDGQRFEVVFIDGLHLAEQVDRDIGNALAHLAEDGFIVLHDCNPPTIFHNREDYDYRLTPAEGAWTGTTWKAYVKWRSRGDLYSCCVDTDYGIGILSRSLDFGRDRPRVSNSFYEYRVLEANRRDQLGLISPSEFATLLGSHFPASNSEMR